MTELRTEEMLEVILLNMMGVMLTVCMTMAGSSTHSPAPQGRPP